MKLPLLLLCLLFSQINVLAQVRYWVSDTLDNWSSNNWSSSPNAASDGLGPPNTTQKAYFNNNHPGDCRLDQAVNIESITLDATYLGTLDLNGFSIDIVGSNDNNFIGGSLSDVTNNSLLSINSTGRTVCSGTVFSVPLNIISHNIFLNGSIFNRNCLFNKNGNGNDLSSGANVFNASLSIINGSSSYLTLGANQADIFNQDVSISNTGSNLIHLAYNSLGNQFNGNIILSSVNGQGIRFGQGSANNDAVLAATKNISIGIAGFSAGTLELKNFRQLGSQDQQLNLSGTAVLSLENGTIFNGKLTSTAPQILSTGAQYNAVVSFEKTGASNNYSIGNNVFNDTTLLKNSGTGTLGFGNTLPDIFNAPLTIHSQGSGQVFLANNSIGNQVNANLTVINQSNSNNKHIYLANGSNSSLNITGSCSIVNQGSSANNSVYAGNSGSINFGADLSIQNIGTGINSAVYLNDRNSSSNNYAGNLTLRSSAGKGIYFGQNGGSATLAATKKIALSPAGFSAGNLTLRNFTQLGLTPQDLHLTGTAYLYMRATTWGTDVDFTAPRIYCWNNTFQGNLKLTKTGAFSDYSPGGNLVVGDTELNNSGSAYLVMGNGTADVFSGHLILRNSGTSNTYLANNGAGHRIDGNLNIFQLSSSNSSIILASSPSASLTVGGLTEVVNNGTATNNVFLGNSGSIVFNGKITLNNIGAGVNSRICLNARTGSLNIYNDDIELNATNGQGIRFGESGGAAQLAATKRIRLGLSGFNAGNLVFRNLTQLGTTPQQLVLTGTAYLYIRASDWGGAVQFTAPKLYSRNTTFNGTCLLHKTGAGNDSSPGGNLFKQNTEIRNSGSGNFVLGNGTADEFRENLSLNNTGTANLQLAEAGSGHLVDGTLTIVQTATATNSSTYLSSRNGSELTVGGAAQVFNNGTGTNNRIFLGGSGSVFFDSSLDIANIGSGSNAAVYLNYRASSSNTYNEDIQVTSTAGQGIRFGDNGGNAVLAATKSISVGSLGFSSGMLVFRNFVQLGSTPQTLTLTGSAYMYHKDAQWGGDVNFSSPRYYTDNTRYQGDATIAKTGAINDYSPGGNYFQGETTISHAGDNYMTMGNGQADSFRTNLTVINSGTGSFYLANQSPNHYVGGNLNLSHLGSSVNSSLYVANNTLSSLQVNGNTNLINNATANSNRVYLGNYGRITFNGLLQLHNIGTGTNSGIFLNYRSSSLNTYNGDILLECTSGLGIRFGESNGQAILAAGKTASLLNSFSSGQLLFRNFTQIGNQAQQIQLTNTATFYNYDADWGGNVNFEGPRLYTRGTSYRGTALLVKSGINSDYSNGNNIFYESCELINTADGLLVMGNGNPDIFEKVATFRNTGQSRIYIAHNSAGNQFNDKVYFYNAATDASNNDCQLNCGANSTATFKDAVFLVNQATGYNTFAVSSYGQANFEGPLSLLNHGSHNSNFIQINQNSGSSIFEDNILVESTNGNGIYFGRSGGNSTLSNNAQLLIGPAGYNKGNLYLRNFTQIGTTAQSLNLTGTSLLTHYENNWNAAVQFVAPRQIFRSTIFNGPAYLEKSGPISDYSYGDCVFNGQTTVHNSSINSMIISNNAPNDYNAAVLFQQSNTGKLYPTFNQTCTFASDINIDFLPGQSVLFGLNNNASVILDGNQVQAINDIANSDDPIFKNLLVSQAAGASVQLNTAASVSAELQLNQGIIYNQQSTVLRLLDNAYVNVVSDASYVEGPVEKIGNDAFTFPIGKNNRYRPCGISAPNTGLASFRAEYFQNNPDPLYNTNLKETTIDFVSNCEYWMIDRTAANSNVLVTLSWNDQTSCGLKQLPLTKVIRWNGTLWQDHGNSNPTTETVSSASAITNFSPFTMSVIDPGLPVEWLQFDVKRTLNDLVDIDWTTATETNNLGFEVQRMLDNEPSFTKIAWLDGQGSTTDMHQYYLADNNAHRGQSYYRLKQIDVDGSVSYSETKAVAGLRTDIVFEATLFPNPVKDILNIRTDNLAQDGQVLTIKMIKANGQLVWSKKVVSKPFNQYSFELDQTIASGVYFVQLSNERGDNKSYKFLKVD